MANSAKRAFALLVASFVSLAFAHAASAVMEEDEDEGSKYTRSGFYLGAGGVAGFPHNWNSDFDGHLNDEASDLANANAQHALDPSVTPEETIVPLSVTVNGAELEDTMFGINGVLGYRAGALVAFEVEGEWIITTDNKTDLDVNAVSEPLPGEFIHQTSTGTHTAEVSDIWNITANIKLYPPFIGWLRHLERFQPYAKVGVGVQHSELEYEITTSDFITTNLIRDQPPVLFAPADFILKSTKTSTDGVLRVGGGFDIYATRNIVSEISAAYVVPFSDTGFLNTDYVSVQWRLVYRF
jgi:opacity protein-like surface antigen